MYRPFNYLAIIVCFLLIGGNGLAAQGEIHPAVKRVQKLVETLNMAMNDPELGFTGRYELLHPVVQDLFSLELMARISTGRYWQELSPAEQQQLAELYASWSAATYANRFDQPGPRFKVEPEVSTVSQGIMVKSTLTKKNNETVDFQYLLRPNGDNWNIFDIRVRGVSQLANTRAQFVPLLKREGFDGLVQTIRDKIAGLSESESGEGIIPE